MSDGRASLTDQAHRFLRQAIIRCELLPGALVTEAQLVEKYGLGKTPVRESLTRLIQEGLVRNIPHHGYVIRPVTLDDVREIFAMRMIIEPAAAQLAAGHVDAQQLRALDRLGAEDSASAGKNGFDAHLRANREFHIQIAVAAQNQRLADSVARLLDESDRIFSLAMLIRPGPEIRRHQHRELVDALVKGDADTARRVTTDQLLVAERQLIEILMSSPSVRAAHAVVPLEVRRSVAPRGAKPRTGARAKRRT